GSPVHGASSGFVRGLRALSTGVRCRTAPAWTTVSGGRGEVGLRRAGPAGDRCWTGAGNGAGYGQHSLAGRAGRTRHGAGNGTSNDITPFSCMNTGKSSQMSALRSAGT